MFKSLVRTTRSALTRNTSSTSQSSVLAEITEKYPNIKKEDLEHLSLVESEIDLRDKKAIQAELAKQLYGHKDALYF